MEVSQSTPRMHPLVAGAAGSVILASLLGVAAIAGLLPNSHGNAVGSQAPVATPAAQMAMSVPAALPAGAPVLVQTPNGYQYMQPVASPAVAGYQVAPTPSMTKQKTVVHHVYRHHDSSYAQAQYEAPIQQSRQVAQASPVSQMSPLGIATGAVIGGLLGHQVGGGNGRTLATVAGVVGGGYLGNTVAKNYGY
ncbi:glycine zipper 2TM domain-containing protein [Glaciimonas sp. CA11.2]|uniref:glycine zipper 2TM domain-containing protein n=1 Tax=Glaciimonas sp. CA11.2 TaxID=3048601 RepID=UPI002AB53A9C|nr:glycine zipper 2TM domain-containing protein [Glaciimonas sp. CA11.2]MDY7546552.1 glycine zipper 2TM domain-containing protein [Glaciimonas sp. CA11.2]MEB0162626.1 glycine zipper 2TM domain-containing protein [Glaciimonas sp. CA11.2]